MAYSSYISLLSEERINKQTKINIIRCQKERVRKEDQSVTVDYTRLSKHNREYTIDEKKFNADSHTHSSVQHAELLDFKTHS